MVGYLFLCLISRAPYLTGREDVSCSRLAPGSLPALSSLKKIPANLLVGSSARIQIKRLSSPILIGKGR
jgi:hypothetical protein